MRLAVTLAVGLLALGAAGCTTDDDTPTTAQPSENPAAAPFSRSEALACLRKEGTTVQALRPSDQQLRALRDLAQGRSILVHLDGTIIPMAFARDVAAAALLVELLSVPGSAYKVVRRGNVVVLLPNEDSALNESLARCLPG